MDLILITVLSLLLIISAVCLWMLLGARSSNSMNEKSREYERQIALLEQRLAVQQAASEERMARHDAEFRRQSAIDIDLTLSPLKQKLAEFQQTVNDTYMQDNASRAVLASRIDGLIQSNNLISTEARRLSNALRGDNRSQGVWGENVLLQLLESSGMIHDVHYLSQPSVIAGKPLRTDEGSPLRPDYVLLLPDEHRIVIDAKTSLTDYLRYSETTDETLAREALRRHVSSVRKHIKELAEKQYHKLIPGALEHTLMFMPNEGAFLAALRADAGLCEYASRNNVVIVSPAHLLSVVQLISQMWRIERQNRNAEAIAEAGGRLYDRFVAFLTDFEKIERNLQTSLKAYESCRHHISGGNQSLSARAERLRKMGAKVTRRIPDNYILSSDADSPDDDAQES